MDKNHKRQGKGKSMDSQAQTQPLLLEDALLQENNELYAGDGSVDFHGKPVLKGKTGNWRACSFIIGNECSDNLAYYGIAKNIISYLTVKLHEGNVSAARHVATWTGTCFLTPLLGAFLADAYWGRYWTIAVCSTVYVIGMCTLTLSASFPAFKPAECVGSTCPSATPAQYSVFFLGLYLIALAIGGIKACLPSFGANQFDDTDPKERVSKGSFFNWYYFAHSIGSFVSSSLIVWIQENVGWGIGFGIPALFMAFSVASFFAGTPLYRFQKPRGSPLTRILQVLVASWHKCKLEVPNDSSLLYETSDIHSAVEGSRKLEHTQELAWLDKAAVLSDNERGTLNLTNNPRRLCTVTQVEELKILIRMFPIWATAIIFDTVYFQMSTMFVEQGTVMDRTLGSFTIPAASLSIFDVMSVIVWVPVYDQIIVPIARKFTGKESGFSELQRIGIGFFISIFAMIAAATVEIRRLQIATELNLVEESVAVPLNILWQIPQFSLVGAAEVFTYVGYMEFFYDQSPDSMRCLTSALLLLAGSVGSYLNSLILTIVTAITTGGGKPGWIPDNLNKGHLDYFFWLLAGVSSLNLVVFVCCARRYKLKNVQ